ncbi:hypothetical protein C8T65DRAFT_744448 [Cerioporus squamosus]|nr:hypothetical protein C8T65DRAFT_744448 [Cerioporus squamosus]
MADSSDNPKDCPTFSESHWVKGESDAVWRTGEHGTVTVYYPGKPNTPSVVGRAPPSRAIRPQVILNYYAQKNWEKRSREEHPWFIFSAELQTQWHDKDFNWRLCHDTRHDTRSVEPRYNSIDSLSNETLFPVAHIGYAELHLPLVAVCVNEAAVHVPQCYRSTSKRGPQPLWGSHVHPVEEPADPPSTRNSEVGGSGLLEGNYSGLEQYEGEGGVFSGNYSRREQYEGEGDNHFGGSHVHPVEEPADPPSTRNSEVGGSGLLEGNYSGLEQYEGEGGVFSGNYSRREQYEGEGDNHFGGSHVHPVEKPADPPSTRNSEVGGSGLLEGNYSGLEQYEGEGGVFSGNYSRREQYEGEGDNHFGGSHVHPVEEPADPPSTRNSEVGGSGLLEGNYSGLEQYEGEGGVFSGNYSRREQYEGEGDNHFGGSHVHPVEKPADPPSTRNSEVGGSGLLEGNYSGLEQYEGEGGVFSGNYSRRDQYEGEGDNHFGGSHVHPVEKPADPPSTRNSEVGGSGLLEGNYSGLEQYEGEGGVFSGNYSRRDQYEGEGDNHFGGSHVHPVEKPADPPSTRNSEVGGSGVFWGNYSACEQYEGQGGSFFPGSYVDHIEELPALPSPNPSEQYTTSNIHRSQIPFPRPLYHTSNHSYTGQLGTNPTFHPHLTNSAFNAATATYPVFYTMSGAAHLQPDPNHLSQEAATHYFAHSIIPYSEIPEAIHP